MELLIPRRATFTNLRCRIAAPQHASNTRISERLQALQDIKEAVESAVVTLVVGPLTQSLVNCAIEDRIRMLFALYDGIRAHRYLSPGYQCWVPC